MKLVLNVMLMLLMVSSTHFAESHSIDEIRDKFQKAIDNSNMTDKLSMELNKIQKPEPLVLAYIASLEALKAKHSWSPVSKLQYMESHKRMMNDAVRKSPNSMEIRYLRYNIQRSVPSYLGYSKNLAEDKMFIVDAFINKKFDSKNKKLIKEVYDYMVQSNSLTPEEKLKMGKVLKSL